MDKITEFSPPIVSSFRRNDYSSPPSSAKFPHSGSDPIIFTVSRNHNYVVFDSSELDTQLAPARICKGGLASCSAAPACGTAYKIASVSSGYDDNFFLLHSSSRACIYYSGNASLLESVGLEGMPANAYNIAYNHYTRTLLYVNSAGALAIMTKDHLGASYKISYVYSHASAFLSAYMLPTYDYWHLLLTGESSVMVVNCRNPYFPVVE